MGTTPIELAEEFLFQTVIHPALDSELSDEMKRKVSYSGGWISRFKRVGDLLVYLKRFNLGNEAPIYKEMKRFGLTTFEDIVGDFEIRFGRWANDCSRITDFEIGREYDVHDILILARHYNTQAGGMFVLEANKNAIAAIIKATLQDGQYPNEWIEEGTLLKYYLKSKREKNSEKANFGEYFKENKAILEVQDLPILTFSRPSNSGRFVFRGIFKYENIVRQVDGSKAFILRLEDRQPETIAIDAHYANSKLANAVRVSSQSPREQRLLRLAEAPTKPSAIRVFSTAYQRNPDVISEVLFRSKGVCEECNRGAPFNRKSDGTPFLEVHHRLPLAAGGDDTIENALALCPNCHREQHYG
ncbi:HNH endonuclease [Herbaspirillum sp. NPDC101396]|uniref:HNH endonuclease n=1 Tax=Herbaspirillum sp. NPDC101396 TaxID=3364005 RepID=UPI00383AC6AC